MAILSNHISPSHQPSAKKTKTMSLISSSKTLVLTLAATFVAAAGAFAQPALKLEILFDAKGTYKLFQSGEVEILIENTRSTAPSQVGTNPDAIDALNTAYNVRVIKLMLVGSDVYGNRVSIANRDLGFFAPNGSDTLGPKGRVQRKIGFSIPNDGTLHNPSDPGYSVVVEVQYNLSDGTVASTTLRAGTLPNVLVSVLPNLELPAMTFPARPDHRAGEVVQFTATIRNTLGAEGNRASRPIGSSPGDVYRLNTYLTTDPQIGGSNNDDFLLDFMDLSGDMGGTVVDSSSTIRKIRVVGTPLALPPYGDPSDPSTARTYVPQPDDGILDIGEELILDYEILVPACYRGNYFVAGFVDAINGVAEPTTSETGGRYRSPRGWLESDQTTPSDNHWGSWPAVRFGIQATSDAKLDLVSGSINADSGLVAVSSDDASDFPAVSGNGEVVAFSSLARNLDSTGLSANGRRHIYVKATDRRTGAVTTRLVSRSTANVLGNANCTDDPAVSSNGRFVAFASGASNLAPRDTNGTSDIFVHDLLLGITTRVSVTSAGLQANGASFRPSISEDGRYIAFDSRATNLLPAGTAPRGHSQVFVVDRDKDNNGIFDEVGTGKTATYLASINKSNVWGNAMSYLGRISADGTQLAFVSHATNLDPVYGRKPFSSIYRIALKDGVPQKDKIEVVSVPDEATMPGFETDATSYEIAINRDGNHIAFTSEATNLVDDDTNEVGDVFVRDYSVAGSPKTVRVSRSAQRSATGTLTVLGNNGLLRPANNIPANNVSPGDKFKLDDGSNSPLDFIVGGNWPVGAKPIASSSRDSLVLAINASGLDIKARSTTPSIPVTKFLATATAYWPSIELYNALPGALGNTAATLGTPSPTIAFAGMSGGGSQAEDLEQEPGVPAEDLRTVPSGSNTPSVDASGRYVAYRSVGYNLDVYKPDPLDALPAPRNSLRAGERLRPLINYSSNVYVHDRCVDGRDNGSGQLILDDPDNFTSTRVSVNQFGYCTTGLLGEWSSANSHSPAISGDGLRVAFSSDSENNGGIIFGRNNQSPLDSNSRRDVYVYKRTDVPDNGADSLSTQGIGFAPIATPIKYGRQIIQLRATASSGLPVAFTSSDRSVAVVDGNTLIIVGAGTTIIAANQAGNADFAPAKEVLQQLVVQKGQQLITFVQPLDVNSEDPRQFQLEASVNSLLPLTYQSSDTKIAVVSQAGVVSIPRGASGPVTITVRQAGDGSWEAAAPISRTFQVSTQVASDLKFSLTNAQLNEQLASPRRTIPLTATTKNGTTPVVFESSSPTVVSIGPVTTTGPDPQGTYTAKATATVSGVGQTVLRAIQAASPGSLAAIPVAYKIVVSKGTVAALKQLAPVTMPATDIPLETADAAGRAITHTITSGGDNAAIVSGKLQIKKAGTVVVRSVAKDNGNFVVLDQSRTLTVNQGTQRIAWNAPTTMIDGTIKPSPAPRTTTGGLTVTYTSSNPSVVRVSGNTITLLGKGFATVTATAKGDDKYKAPSQVAYRVGRPY